MQNALETGKRIGDHDHGGASFCGWRKQPRSGRRGAPPFPQPRFLTPDGRQRNIKTCALGFLEFGSAQRTINSREPKERGRVE